MKMLMHRIAQLAFAAAIVLTASVPASAATWTVKSLSDLYWVLDGGNYGYGLAEDGDTIVFDDSLSGQTLKFPNGSNEIDIYASVDILGPPGGVTLDGNYARVFRLAEGANVMISGLTLTGGGGWFYNLPEEAGPGPGEWSDDGYGGAILNYGTLTLSDCVLSENGADFGGAVFNSGTMTITHCTVSNNVADYLGGGIYNDGTMTILYCTINGNLAGWSGNNLYNSNSGELTVKKSSIPKK